MVYEVRRLSQVVKAEVCKTSIGGSNPPVALMRHDAVVMFIDTDCAICVSGAAYLERQLSELDIRSTQEYEVLSAFGIDLHQAQKSIHVIDKHGRVLKDIDAVKYLGKLVGWPNWLLNVIEFKPVKLVGKLVYYLISRNRSRLSELYETVVNGR
jgi:predicted DCC family thiol-disulfide oxidoreductase YuxK